MKELKVNSNETKQFFIGAFKEGNLIPILGAGFTAGQPTRGGKIVPNGSELKLYMIRQITKIIPSISEQELKEEPFSMVAELFEKNYSNIKETGVLDYFYNHFTRVKIKQENQNKFLNEIGWQYIYTLNIDTGIEDSVEGNWEVFYPNKNFDDKIDFDGKKRLYKIHGDARLFTKTLDYDDMILTESQYMRSLSKNKKFHDMLSADCGNKNMIYIGCSLDDELDIKYSVLSDRNRNFKDKETYRIYVTAQPISDLKKEKLEGFNISHFIQLQADEDYDLFYEYLFQCYQESLEKQEMVLKKLTYHQPQKLEQDLEKNIQYLADINKCKDKLPYYYFESEILDKMHLDSRKINVFSGRRFSGKTMLAYNILDHYQGYQRYFINGQESIDRKTIRTLMKLKNSLIVFDSDAIDDRNFMEIYNEFEADKGNLVCVFFNSYDEIFNIISRYEEDLHKPLDHTMIGKMSAEDNNRMNTGLDAIGIAKFNVANNILDNTLRIANVYNKNVVSNYSIVSKEELIVIIWLLVQNKMYYEEIVSLGLSREYKNIVDKFAPFLQEEKCKKSEVRKHSTYKIICNGKLGLLQILNNYAYTQKNEMGNVVAKARHQLICESIYYILYSFSQTDNEFIKKFIMFDTLNDIFSRKYSQQNIEYMQSEGKKGKRVEGAAGLIQKIYEDNRIQQLKASDPNYWLQRAKSIYMTYREKRDIEKLRMGIDWAIKAEQDSEIKIEHGEKYYERTKSNATIQIAIMYGRVAKLNGYKKKTDNNKAIEYYYKGLSDYNNRAAAQSIINHSKGTDDFNSLVKDMVVHPNHIDQEWAQERDFLIKTSITGSVNFSI